MRRNYLIFAAIVGLVAISSADAKPRHGGGGGPPTPPPVLAGEEFVGPFASWMCVMPAAAPGNPCGAASKQYFTAVGDGSTDDTAAIQACITALSTTQPVCYFPAPSVYYKITSTLVWPGGGQTCSTNPTVGSNYSKLVGADPATVTIKWGGAAGGTMLCLNGVGQSTISRITFDANTVNSAKLIIDQEWAGGGPVADSGNEFSDLVLKNAGSSSGVGFAYMCGGLQCSETSLLRVQFLNNVVGLQTTGQNALDMWCWYCNFQSNQFGMSSAGTPHGVPGAPCGINDCAGGFQSFFSVFQNTVNNDLTWGNTGVIFNFIGNYSSGANRFINSGGTGAYDTVVLKENTIVNTGAAISICDTDPGPILFVKNTVVSSGTGAIQTCTSGVSAAALVAVGDEILAKDNIYNAGSGTCPTSGSSSAPVNSRGGRCHEFNETIHAISPPPPPPTLPGVPPNNHRTIFEASAAGSGTTCSSSTPCSLQTAICLAATGSSGFSAGNCTGTVVASRNVVHFVVGTLNTGITIVFPATADIQLLCDGYNSQIVPSGLSGIPTIKILGPSRVVIRDCEVSGSTGSSVDAIEISNVDQIGSIVWADQLLMGNNSGRNVFSDSGLINVAVEIHNSHIYDVTDAGIVVSGANAVSLFACVSISVGPNGVHSLTGAGSLLVDACWNDGGPQKLASVSGSGSFTMLGSHGGMSASSPTAAALTGYTGTATIGSFDITPGGFVGTPTIDVGTSSGATVLGWGLAGNPTYWNTSGAFAGTTGFLNSGAYFGSGADINPLTEVAASNPFINAAFNLFETTDPTLPAYQSDPTITAIQLHRVYLSAGRRGLWVH